MKIERDYDRLPNVRGQDSCSSGAEYQRLKAMLSQRFGPAAEKKLALNYQRCDIRFISMNVWKTQKMY
jgi:hypothetical protein